MRILLLLVATLGLGAQTQPLVVALEPQSKDQAVAVDAALLHADLQSLLRENGYSEASAGAPNLPKLTLRPESFRMQDGLSAISAVAYLERPGQAQVLRGRIVTALRSDATLGLELRQASLDVVAALLNRNQPQGGQVRRLAVEGRPGPEQVAEVPFKDLKVRVHPLNPMYPRLARQRGVQGRVKVRLTLDAEGRPLRADLVSGPDELSLTGLYSAMRWSFEPVRGPAGPVEARTEMEVPFSLSGGLGDPSLPPPDMPAVKTINDQLREMRGEAKRP